MRYDPQRPVAARDWSALDEDERNALVLEYHRRTGVKLPNLKLHCTLHVIIENQAVLGDETPVAAALQRLVGEGLDRHDAIHAIAAELSVTMFKLVTPPAGQNLNDVYFDKVRKLTAATWRAS
jgi:hypothetical protein